MNSTIEYIALGVVALVFVISVVQAVQLGGLNEKISQQNTALAALASTGNLSALASTGSSPTQQPSASTGSSTQMVGGC